MMSYNWENVVWESKDGLWNVGFFERISGGSYDDDEYDSEWDDEFNLSAFCFASRCHNTSDAASRAWDGANPGGTYEVKYSRATAKDIEEYNNMAKAWNDPLFAKKLALDKAKVEIRQIRSHLVKKLRETPLSDANRVQVQFAKNPDSASSRSVVTERLIKEGDWLGVMVTKTLATKINQKRGRSLIIFSDLPLSPL